VAWLANLLHSKRGHPFLSKMEKEFRCLTQEVIKLEHIDLVKADDAIAKGSVLSVYRSTVVGKNKACTEAIEICGRALAFAGKQGYVRDNEIECCLRDCYGFLLTYSSQWLVPCVKSRLVR
jgi:hypothetical protein